MNRVQVRQSQNELKHILKRLHKGTPKPTDRQRLQELRDYLETVGMSLRYKSQRMAQK